MKKIFSMAAIALFMAMTSCSGDDSSETTNPSTETVLLKKTVTTYEDGSTGTCEFTYHGNQLIKVTYEDGMYDEYIYNNDHLLAELRTFENGLIYNKYVYEYDDSNKLITVTETHPNSIGSYDITTTFTHNNDNTITAKRYLSMGEAEGELVDTHIITFTNNNITLINTHEVGTNDEYTTSFTYDNKNNPMKNIHAYDVITLIDYRYGGGINNLVSETDSIDGVLYTSEYEYNSNGYPTTMTDNEDGEQTTTQFFYE